MAESQLPAATADVEMQHEISEADLPYNARLSAIYEKSHAPFGGEGAVLPSFKPVDWSRQAASYDDEEEEEESDMHDSEGVLSPSAITSASGPYMFTSPMDVDEAPPAPAVDTQQMDEAQNRPRQRSDSKKNLSIDLSMSPTITKAKLSLVESASPLQLRASLSPVNALTILSHPPPRAAGMAVDSPTSSYIVPISI